MAIAAALIGTRGTTTTATVTTTAGTSTGGSGTIFQIFVSFDPGVTISSVTDSKSNTYSLVGTVVTGRGKLARYRCVGGTGGASHTATVNFSGNAFAVAHLVEVTGAATSTPGDISTSAVDTTSPYTISSGTLAQAAEVVIAAIESNTGVNGAYSESTGFTILSQESDFNNFWTSAVASLVVASTTGVTPSFTRSGDDDAFDAALVLDTFKEASGGPTPSVTSTSSATPSNGASLTITGTDFGASQGNGSVTIGGVVQTVISWADTSITVYVARGANKYGTSVDVVVTDNALASSSPYALTSLQPQSGWSFVDLSTPNTTAVNRIRTTPDLVSGDQIAYDNVGGQVTVANDATFSAGTSVRAFDFEVWSSPEGWGYGATQYLQTQPLTSQGMYAARVAMSRRRQLSAYALDPQNWGRTSLVVQKWFADELAAPSGGSPTHPSTGALTADAATIAGTAAHLTLHTSTGALTAQDATIAGTAADEHSNTGALTAQAATVAGTAAHLTLHTSTGTLTAQDATIAGTAADEHATTGALSAQAAAIAGTAVHLTLHATTGALAAQASTIAGVAAHQHAATGALVAQDATIAGSADHTVPGSTHTTTGALAAQDATVAGTATHLTLHTSTGALTAQAAAIAGTAAHQHAAAGALAADAATIDGAAAHLVLHTSTGALTAQPAAISGAAAHEHAATGALAADAATIAGTAEHSAAGTHDAIGALAAQDATMSGVAEHIGTGESVLSPKFLGSPNVVIRGVKAEEEPTDAEPLPAQITNVPDAPPPVKLGRGVMDLLGFAPPVTPLPIETPEVPEPKVVSRKPPTPPEALAAEAPAVAPAPPPPPPAPVAPVDPVKVVEARLDALNSQLETALSEVAALRAKLEDQASAQVQVKTVVERVVGDTTAIARREQNRQRAEEITRRLLKDLAEED